MFSRILEKHLASQKKNKIFFSSLLAITTILAFTACKVDIRNFLKENTEIAAVDKCLNESDLKPYEITDPNGNYVYCIPSNNDLVIKFRLRNPQNYELIPSTPETYRSTAATNYQTGDPSITVSFDTLGKDYIDTYDTPSVLTKKPSNSNQAYDALLEIDDECYYLTLTYTRDFLLKTEMGHNISPTVLLRHPKTKNDFESYSELNIACNSPPPAVSGPIVYQDESKYPNQYILLFNMPQTDDLKGIHNDIKHLYIKSDGDGRGNAPFDYDYQVEVDGTGVFTLSGSAPTPTIGKEAVNDKLKNNYITPTGAVFTAGENPVYIPLEHKLSYNEILYAFTLADSWNLKSAQAEASISSKKLSDPYFTDSKNILILGGEGIPQDKNSSYATFNFIPALLTYWFEDKTTGLVQNKYYVDESNEGNRVSVPKNFVFDETKINEQTSSVETIIALQELLTNTLPSDAYLKENTNGVITKVPLENKLSNWVIQHANTSKCTIEYSVSQVFEEENENGTITTTTAQLFSGHFDSEESSGTSPQKQNNKLLTNGNTLKTAGHYTSVELPGGKLLVTVYAHKTGYADSNPVEYRFEVLRTRVYVSDKTDSNDTKNNGSANSHFKTITNAANRLSIRTDTTNTIYLDSDITEDIEIPAAEENDKPLTYIDETKPLYVTIKPTEGTRTITAENGTLLNIPDGSTVILENLILKNGNIKVGENAKLYLNNVTFTGDNTEPINKIIVAPTGIVILGGKTNIDSTFIGQDEDLNDIYQNIIELEERIDEVVDEITGEKELIPRSGKVQLGTTTPSRRYEPQGNLVVLQTKKEHPRLNNIILEIDDGNPLKNNSMYNNIYLDLTKEDESQAYQLFRLNNSGYYIGYDDIYKPDSKTYGRGLVKIPGAEITEPSVGGFEAKLKTSSGTVLNPTSSNEYNGNLYIITKGAKITYSISDSNSEAINKELSLGLFKNLKMELYLEGGKPIQESSNITEPVLAIPTTYPEGYYSISVYFTFNDITYCEQFNVYLKEAD